MTMTKLIGVEELLNERTHEPSDNYVSSDVRCDGGEVRGIVIKTGVAPAIISFLAQHIEIIDAYEEDGFDCCAFQNFTFKATSEKTFIVPASDVKSHQPSLTALYCFVVTNFVHEFVSCVHGTHLDSYIDLKRRVRTLRNSDELHQRAFGLPALEAAFKA